MLADRLRQAATVKGVSGQQAYTTAGTYTFTVPAGVTSVSVLCVGGGQGGSNQIGGPGGDGGSLSYKNSITVSPGENCTVTVGDKSNGSTDTASAASDSSFVLSNASLEVMAKGGGSSSSNIGTAYAGGIGKESGSTSRKGGGGAGGYSGVGGNGGENTTSGSSGSGGGGGGGGGAGFAYIWYLDGTERYGGGGGGGVGILGSGSNGAGGAAGVNVEGGGGGGGGGGSSGSNGGSSSSVYGASGGAYGGGGGTGGSFTDSNTLVTTYYAGGNGAVGAVRIIWGAGRSYPSNAANV